ncbi:MAG: hypothetical protein JWQ35_818 [Bacteriovoracaceae bacterium]|nr:hypothetical protein [Bacteriovoracaceae bacterium]
MRSFFRIVLFALCAPLLIWAGEPQRERLRDSDRYCYYFISLLEESESEFHAQTSIPIFSDLKGESMTGKAVRYGLDHPASPEIIKRIKNLAERSEVVGKTVMDRWKVLNEIEKKNFVETVEFEGLNQEFTAHATKMQYYREMARAMEEPWNPNFDSYRTGLKRLPEPSSGLVSAVQFGISKAGNPGLIKDAETMVNIYNSRLIWAENILKENHRKNAGKVIVDIDEDRIKTILNERTFYRSILVALKHPEAYIAAHYTRPVLPIE